MKQTFKQSFDDEEINIVTTNHWSQKIYQKIDKEHLAFILVFISIFFYPLGFIYSNQNKLNSLQTALLRGIALIVISYTLAKWLNISLDFKSPKNWRIMTVRSSVVMIQGIYFAGMQFYLTQPLVQTLNSTGPLFVFLLDYKINNVKVTKIQFIGIIIGIVGVILAVNGQLLMQVFNSNYSNSSTFENYRTNDPYFQLLVGLIYVLIQILWAWAMIMTKQMVGINCVQINFHLGVLIMFSTGILYPIYVPERVDLDKMFWGLLFVGFPIALSGFLFNAALTMSHKTGSLTILIFLSVIIGYILSIFRYNESINPICSIGSVLIIYGLTQTILEKKRKPDELTNSKSTIKLQSSQLSNEQKYQI